MHMHGCLNYWLNFQAMWYQVDWIDSAHWGSLASHHWPVNPSMECSEEDSEQLPSKRRDHNGNGWLKFSIVTGNLITAQDLSPPVGAMTIAMCANFWLRYPNAISAISSQWPTVIWAIWKSVNNWTHQSIKQSISKSVNQPFHSFNHSTNDNFIIPLLMLSVTDPPTNWLTNSSIYYLFTYAHLFRHTQPIHASNSLTLWTQLLFHLPSTFIRFSLTQSLTS